MKTENRDPDLWQVLYRSWFGLIPAHTAPLDKNAAAALGAGIRQTMNCEFAIVRYVPGVRH